MSTGAFVMAGMALVRMGRFVEAERHLARAEECLRAAADPGTELVVHHARGILSFGEGRFDEAVAEFARAQNLERLLAGEHVFKVDVRGRALQVRVRTGDIETARLELAGLSPDQRNRAAMRIALAAMELEQDNPEGAVEALAPVLDGSAPALSHRWARVEALLLDATARDRLGDRRAAEESAGGGARPRRARGPDPALPALAEPRPARASSETPDRPRDAHLDDPRHAGRAHRSSARAGGAACAMN